MQFLQLMWNIEPSANIIILKTTKEHSLIRKFLVFSLKALMNLQTKIQIAKTTMAATLFFFTLFLLQLQGSPGLTGARPCTSPELQHGQPWKAGEIPDFCSKTLMLSPGLPTFFHPTASSHVPFCGEHWAGGAEQQKNHTFKSWDWAQCAQSLPPPLTGTRLTAQPCHQRNARTACAHRRGTGAGTCGSRWGRSCRREMRADMWASLSLS